MYVLLHFHRKNMFYLCDLYICSFFQIVANHYFYYNSMKQNILFRDYVFIVLLLDQ